MPAVDTMWPQEGAPGKGVSWGFPGAFPVSWRGSAVNAEPVPGRSWTGFLETSTPEPPFSAPLWPPPACPVLPPPASFRSACFPSCRSVISPPPPVSAVSSDGGTTHCMPLFHAPSPAFSIVSEDAFVQQTSLRVPCRYWQWVHRGSWTG